MTFAVYEIRDTAFRYTGVRFEAISWEEAYEFAVDRVLMNGIGSAWQLRKVEE